MKRIFAVTGTRADYGIYRPVFQAMTKSKKLTLELLVTGMHLLPEFGSTVEEIRADGLSVAAEVPTMTTEDTLGSMAQYVGRTTVEFARILAKEIPDAVFLLGDRGEQLAGAIAAKELRIPIIHLHGGEQTGSIDDPVRHAITMMADVHCTTAPEHSKNVARMRPESTSVHTVGAPALDVVYTLEPMDRGELVKHAGFDPKLPILLFVQHPDTLEVRTPKDQIVPSIAALEGFSGNILIIGSNADAGGMQFNAALQAFASKRKNTAFRISIPHREFLSWHRVASVLVGNSSSGIIEAASAHLPVVNIGDRQKGRLRSGNVIDVPYDRDAIRGAIAEATSISFKDRIAGIRNAYGDGHAAEKIVKIMDSM
jgi:UDP-hydrolysing UDP-N-acetyl-D-glucosamine 2-epimerase